MSGSSVVLLVVLAAVAGGVGAWVFTVGDNDSAGAPSPSEAAGSQRDVAARSPASETTPPPAQASVIAARDDRIRDLEAQLREAQGKIEELVAQQASRDAETRATLEMVMARIAALRKQGVGALIDQAAVAALVADLRSLGEAGFQAVVGLLGSDDADERMVATQLLKGLGDPRAVQLLWDALSDPDATVQTLASHALCFMDGAGVLEACRAGLDSKNDSVRVNSMFGLVRQGDQKGVDLTLAILRDESSPFRGPMIQGVLLLGSESAVPLVDEMQVLFRSNADVMKAAVDFYRRVGTEMARSRLQNIAGDPELPQAIRDLALAALN
ncbi:MAG: hypothetical protein CMJ90_04750 [Planctomycetes bacterium]|nr:hypothetical protein [Planctomycetota bacterium]